MSTCFRRARPARGIGPLAVAGVLLAALLLGACDSSTTQTLAPTATPAPLSHITEYPLPRGSYPSQITSGPDGALWFTEAGGNKIARIIP
jgi:streptogramin lyase